MCCTDEACKLDICCSKPLAGHCYNWYSRHSRHNDHNGQHSCHNCHCHHEGSFQSFCFIYSNVYWERSWADFGHSWSWIIDGFLIQLISDIKPPKSRSQFNERFTSLYFQGFSLHSQVLEKLLFKEPFLCLHTKFYQNFVNKVCRWVLKENLVPNWFLSQRT